MKKIIALLSALMFVITGCSSSETAAVQGSVTGQGASINSENNDETELQLSMNMTKTLKIEGMMCSHCEARVKKCLEEINGVESAEVSHEKGTAVVTLTDNVPFDTLKAAVEAQDYKVVG